MLTGNLFASNGSGADSDPDGPPLAVSAVNGSAGSVDTTITLASGASLTVESDGDFIYNPSNAFDPTPTRVRARRTSRCRTASLTRWRAATR